MKTKTLILVVCALAALTLIGCSNASFQRTWGANGRDFTVDCYGAGGTLVREYVTSGKVQSEDGSDGWYFVDAKTGNIVIVSGGLVIITPK